MPAEHVDLPFPGRQTKFSLLNGWRSPPSKSKIRSGYRRARWFLTRRGAERLTFSLRSPEPASFTVLVNGSAAERLKAGPEWTPISLALSWLDPSAPFVVEIRREGDGIDFDAMCFEVRDRERHRKLFGAINWRSRA